MAFAKSTRRRLRSWPTTGPTSPTSKTSRNFACEPMTAKPTQKTPNLFGATDAIATSETASASEPMRSLTNTEALISLRAGCLASLRALSVPNAELLTSDGCGRIPQESCASLCPDSQSLRTRQLSLLSNPGEPGTELFQDWPRSGMIAGGKFFPLPPLVQGISESGSFSFVPTPTARDWKDTPGMKMEAWQRNRCDQLARRMFSLSPTKLPSGHRLNPTFALRLMGYPPDWLKPLYDASETQSSRRLRLKSSTPSDPSKNPNPSNQPQ